MAAILPATAISSSGLTATRRRKTVDGLKSYGGLKAQNKVSSLGRLRCADESFAMIVSSIRIGKQGRSRGGALSSTCSAAAEIFKIAAIMNGLVLVGVAVGFVLLRMEASVEESE